MPRVMMIVEATDGGTARHVVEIALGCHRRGVGVHLVCAVRRDARFRHALRELREAGLAVDEVDMRREIHPLWDGVAVLRLRNLVMAANPDVLHLHSSKAGALGRGAVVGLGQRGPALVYSPHAYAFTAQPGALNRWAYWCVERALMPLTDRVVAVSESEGEAAIRLCGEDRVVIIPNGVDVTRIVPREPGAHARFRVGWLGRMAWQKDPETAVKASFVLSRLGIDHELWLGGDGPERDRVLASIRNVRAEEWVRVVGLVRDTDAFHSGVDLLLMTSQSEGLPYVGLDAMAHGVPIVGFDVPGVRDLVEHGVTGLLAARDDAGALAAHMARLARDMDLCRALGAAARQRARTRFRLDNQVELLCGLYQSLAASRATRLSRRRKGPVHVLARL